MDNFKTWVVGLDLTNKDNFILKNTAALAKKSAPEVIHFVYFPARPDLPQEVLHDIPDLQVPEIQYYESSITKEVQEHFDSEIDWKIHVREGNALTEILRLLNNISADLLILGRGEHTGTLGRKLPRKAPCSVLLIPSKEIKEINTIAVPVDFSPYSDRALNTAKSSADAYGVKDIHVLHVYQDASKYLNQTFETSFEVQEVLAKNKVIDEKLKSYALHKLMEYLNAVEGPDHPLKPHVTSINRTKEVGDAIHDWVMERDIDMLVMGSKGQSAAAAVLLGSVPEQVYSQHFDKYILLAKKKGENISLIKALLKSKA
ncbi:MAG: universal stress protein [Bacteroidota bacterium]